MRGTRSVSTVTALGRAELELLRTAGQSLVEVADACDVRRLQWVIALDSDAMDVERTRAAVCDLDLDVQVLPAPTATPTGPGSTRNRALTVATGDWMLTLDSDDMLAADGVRAILQAAEENTVPWAAGRSCDVDGNGTVTWDGPADDYLPGPVPRGSVFTIRSERGSPPFSHCAAVVRTAVVRDCGGWPEGWFRTEDSALWSVISAKHAGFWVPVRVLKYRKHAASITHQPNYHGSAPELMPLIAEFIARGSTN